MNKWQGNRWWNCQLFPQDVSCHRSWLFWSRTLTWHIGFKQRSLVLVASCSFVLCLIMVVLACQIEAKLYRFRPVYAGVLLSIPSTSSLVPIIIFELNNAGAVCIIVESWSLKVTTPNGTSNLQCNWEFPGVVFGWGRKLTTGCSYGGDVWTIMLCVADWSNKKLWNGNPWRLIITLLFLSAIV